MCQMSRIFSKGYMSAANSWGAFSMNLFFFLTYLTDADILSKIFLSGRIFLWANEIFVTKNVY